MPNALAKCWDSALPVHGWMRGEAVGQPRILGLYNLRESRTRAAEYRSSARGARAGAVRSVARVAVVMSTGQAAGCARFLPAAANDLAVFLFCRHAFCALDVASLLRCQTTALHVSYTCYGRSQSHSHCMPASYAFVVHRSGLVL